MHGMPVISRNVGGIPDHVINGVNGFLTDSTEPDDFANMITRITEDISLFNKFKTNNYEKSNREFIPERLINRLLTLYNYPIN
jgi:glycosyltransferase involved in cell wall biosynthesis